MIKFSFALAVSLLMSACTNFVLDKMEAPSGLNHNRVVMTNGDKTEVGIITVSPKDRVVNIKTYGKGTVELEGLENCGMYEGLSTLKSGVVSVELPESDIPCVYSVQVTSEGFDAPAIGKIIYREFNDPNVEPLNVEINNKAFSGIAFMQTKASERDTTIPLGRDIKLFPKGTSGTIIVSGCGLESEMFLFVNKLSLDVLYKKQAGINKDCIFNILINNDDYLKEAITLYVNVSTGFGFISKPATYESYNRQCFEFGDAFVVGVAVNNEIRYSNKKCVKKSDKYVVEAVTSRHRIFYGIFKNGTWEVK